MLSAIKAKAFYIDLILYSSRKADNIKIIFYLVGGMKKMLYCCETCGKKFTTEEQALDCERVHAEEKAKRDELVKAREDRVKEVNSLFKTFYNAYKSFYNDYGVFPEISGSFNKFSPLEKMIFGMF